MGGRQVVGSWGGGGGGYLKHFSGEAQTAEGGVSVQKETLESRGKTLKILKTLKTSKP